jgi:hypothetical protein
MAKKQKIQTEISVDLGEVMESLLARSEDETLYKLIAEGINQTQAKAYVKRAKQALEATKAPTKGEIVAMNKLIFAKALEANSLGIAQKVIQELARISRIEHMVDVAMPIDVANKKEMVDFLLKNINAIGPSNMTALARLLASTQTIEDKKQEDDTTQDETQIESEDQAMACVLKIINGGK